MMFLDSNIILRYILGDDAHKATRCEQLFRKAAAGDTALFTHVLVIAEVIWVLTGALKVPKERVVDALVQLLAVESIALEDKERVLTALGLYRAKAIDFVDAYHAQYMQDKRVHGIYSYDKDFDVVPGIQRVEP